MPLDADDHGFLGEHLDDIRRAIQDPWDRDSLAKDLFVKHCTEHYGHDEVTRTARIAFDQADAFMAVWEARRDT